MFQILERLMKLLDVRYKVGLPFDIIEVYKNQCSASAARVFVNGTI